jgi:hypothetical protein
LVVLLRVLLALQAIPLVGVGVIIIWFNLAIAALATGDRSQFQGALGFAIVLVSGCLLLGAGTFALTFVKRSWSFAILVAVEILVLLVFGLINALAALPSAGGGHEDSMVWIVRGVGLALAVLPGAICVLLLMPARVHDHFKL